MLCCVFRMKDSDKMMGTTQILAQSTNYPRASTACVLSLQAESLSSSMSYVYRLPSSTFRNRILYKVQFIPLTHSYSLHTDTRFDQNNLRSARAHRHMLILDCSGYDGREVFASPPPPRDDLSSNHSSLPVKLGPPRRPPPWPPPLPQRPRGSGFAGRDRRRRSCPRPSCRRCRPRRVGASRPP